ncbi:MAG: hypothetical protein CMK83_22130 [Pseudomonadales bacterium]|jgi:hypothetical protein|nr:hypothetical protein [Pseudomonadales bacterium]MCK5789391.1 hypothetical protein [Ketobacter sp.]MEC8811665.1 hypothetical protein [Pseudomonadota bacterium]TNC86405.1 MAG: hypothetical protein CSH49_16600 [Alcanivorax sp.]HAG92929.1 hypothetical protein [Gammaproteobacteria bacterium]|tara:strand:+ start:3445 stop:3876 length:432 start_codon:yes stop_codon:yes gene_type:complete
MLTLKLQETMKGWLELNESHRKEAFAFTIEVTFMRRLRPWKPQPFVGSVTLPARNLTTETHGYFTLKPMGPRYELRFDLPGIGAVQASGEKSYDLMNLKDSLTMCPLTLFHNGSAIGYIEVAYEDSLLAFPLKALRVTKYATI